MGLWVYFEGQFSLAGWIGSIRERGVESDAKTFAMSKWKDGVAIN